jgi:hypothetical protein
MNAFTFHVSQVNAYDDRKRLYTVVYVDVTDGNRYNYDRKRTVNHPLHIDSITVVYRRVVYDRIHAS